MWPVKVQRQFDIAQNEGNYALRNAFHGPYNKLLNALFSVDTDFTVIPNFEEVNSPLYADSLVTFEIYLENRPVFILQLKKQNDLRVPSKRDAADGQLRRRLGDLLETCPLSVIHGVSAFGTKLSFYSITKSNRRITRPRVVPSDQYLTDTAPIEHWNYDILEPEGEGEFRSVVKTILDGCAHLPS